MSFCIEKTMKKIRVLHSAALLSPPSGIINQMLNENDAANELAMEWDVKIYCPKTVERENKIYEIDEKIYVNSKSSFIVKALAWLKLRFNYHKWLLENQSYYDVFLLRYYVHDPFQLIFLHRCKKPVYFVHHALEVPELAYDKGLVSILRSNLERVIGRLSIRKANGLVGVTKEIVDYELRRSRVNKPWYVYSNGIKFEKMSLEDQRDKEVPEFLFVANFSPWHGLDLLLESVKKSDKQFVIHLVGLIPFDLQLIIDEIKDERLVLHGQLSIEEIYNLSMQCWVGFSTFAQMRTGMRETCSLKSREYLMFGLPVYSDSKDVFPKDFKFYKVGGACLENIIDYAHYVRKIDKNTVSIESKQYIDKSALLLNFYSWLNKDR